MYTRVSFHLGPFNGTLLYLGFDKIRNLYDQSFAYRTGLHNHNPPGGGTGFKMRIGPPYLHARRKRRLKFGVVSE